MRLIDADAFKQYCIDGMEEMKKYFKTDKGLKLAIETTESFLNDIDEQPTVQPQRPKGKWIVDKEYTSHFSDGRDTIVYSIHCSECNYFSTDNMYRMPYKFCPNCGAEMSGGEEE